MQSLLLAYLPCVLSMMTIGIVVPFLGAIGRELSASPAQLGLAIALFSLPTALLATASGTLIDRYGIRRSLLWAAVCCALGSLAASQARSLLQFDLALLLAGAGFCGACVTAPCLLMATLRDAARTRALSLLATYAPTGYAAGLLLAVPFTPGAWRHALLAHAALLGLAWVLLLVLLPRADIAAATARARRASLTELLAVLREPRALRLALAVALPNAVAYGTSLAAPAYLARTYGVSIAASSTTVALAKILAMIIGGLSMGYILGRSRGGALLFASMAGVGALAQGALFLFGGNLLLASLALLLWLFAFGGMSGGAMNALPAVVRDPARVGATSGLMNQAISIASFATPSLWLALQSGREFVWLAAGCLLLSVLAFPTAALKAPGAAAAR